MHGLEPISTIKDQANLAWYTGPHRFLYMGQHSFHYTGPHYFHYMGQHPFHFDHQPNLHAYGITYYIFNVLQCLEMHVQPNLIGPSIHHRRYPGHSEIPENTLRTLLLSVGSKVTTLLALYFGKYSPT